MGILEDTLQSKASYMGGQVSARDLLTSETTAGNMNVEAAMARVNAGAKLRGTNSSGTTSQSSTNPILSGGAGLPPTGQLVGSNNSTTGVLPDPNAITKESILKGMQEVEKDTDPVSRLNKLTLLNGTIDSHLATQTQKLADVADGMFQVKQLEQSLQENMIADRASPNYHLFLSDSPVTAKVRNDLDVARQQARATTSDLVSKSPQLQELQGMQKIFISKESIITGQMMANQGKEKDKNEFNIARAGTSGIQTAQLLDPALDTPEKAAVFAMANSNDKNFQAVADNLNNPPALIDQAVHGNPLAVTATTKLHAQMMAPTDPVQQKVEEKKAQSYLNDVKRFSTTSEGKAELMKLAFPDPEAAKKFTSDVIQSTLSVSGKDKVNAESQAYQGLAIKVMEAKNKERFLNDVTTWSPSVKGQLLSSPTIKPIIESLAPHGDVSVDKIVGSIAAMSDKTQQKAAMNEMLMYLGNATDEANKGIFGNVGSTLAMQNKMQEVLARASLAHTTTLGGLSGTFGF
jgi:hypothetical protein